MHVLDEAGLHTIYGIYGYIAGGTAERVSGLCAMYHLMVIDANKACHLVALHNAGNAPPAAEFAMHLN